MAVDPQPKLSPQEFAAKIKAKYPQYQSLDDSVLVEKMLAKYPQYQNTVYLEQQPQAQQPVLSDAQNIELQNQALKATNPILNTPFIGDFAIDAGRAMGSVVSDMIPEQVATLQLKGGSARLKELESIVQNPELRTPELLAEIEKEKRGLGVSEGRIQEQKKDSARKLANNIQSLEDITDARTFAKWVGNSIGQAAGQIPLSAATLGASSFLMEAAAVYDQQLELLAEKYGISREEVVKRGLDKPAAGEAYALLAGGLDAISAGSIIKIFKGVAGKELSKKTIGKFLKDSFGEAVTEGTQGQLETLGATRGAGTEFTWNWKQFIDEAAAGAVGAGGISLVTPTQSEADKAVKEAEKLVTSTLREADDLFTGDPELDAQIRKAEQAVGQKITDITAQVDAFAASKVQSELDAAQEAAREARVEAAALTDENELLKLQEQWQSSPTIPTSQAAVPGNRTAFEAARDEENLLADNSAADMLPKPLGISEEEAQWGDDSAKDVAPLPKSPVKAEPIPDLKEPKYHSTDEATILLDDNFDTAVIEKGSGLMHIGDKAAADQRSKERKNTKSKTFSIKLNTKAKFLNVKDTGEPLHSTNIIDGLLAAGDISQQEAASMTEQINNAEDGDQAQLLATQFAKDKGYDAIRYQNIAEGGGYSYGVMRKNAIANLSEIAEKKQNYWITGTDKTGYKVVDKQPRTKEVIESYDSKEAAERGIAQLITENVAYKEDKDEDGNNTEVVVFDRDTLTEKTTKTKTDEVDQVTQIDNSIQEVQKEISELEQLITEIEQSDLNEPQTKLEQAPVEEDTVAPSVELEEAKVELQQLEQTIEEDKTLTEPEKRIVKEATVSNGKIASDKKAASITKRVSAKLQRIITTIRKRIKAIVLAATLAVSMGIAYNVEMATYKLNQMGLINVDEVEIVADTVKRDTTDRKNRFFEIIATAVDANSPSTQDSLMSYRSQWNNKDGFVYIATPNKKQRGGNALTPGKNIEYKNVVGVGHFFIDTDLQGNNATLTLNSAKDTDYIPVFTKVDTVDGGTVVRVNYTQKKNLKTKPDNISTFTPTPLLQWKVSDINWESDVPAELTASGRKSPTVRGVLTKDGKQTGIIFKNKNALSRFSGNSVVFIFNDKNGNTIVRDFAGSFNQIRNEIKSLQADFGLTEDQITIGRYDAGSFSAKPKAKSGTLETDSWNKYNPKDGGAALIIPESPTSQTPVQEGSLSGLALLLLSLRAKRRQGTLTTDESQQLAQLSSGDILSQLKDRLSFLQNQLVELTNRKSELQKQPAKKATGKQKVASVKKFKAEEEVTQDNESKVAKLSQQIVNTLKRSPSDVKKTLAAIADKAAALYEKTKFEGYKTIATEADTQLKAYDTNREKAQYNTLTQKQQDEYDAQKNTPEALSITEFVKKAKKEEAVARKAAVKTKEQVAEERKKKTEERVAKKAASVKGKVLVVDGKETTVEKRGEQLYMNIAKAMANEEGTKAVDSAIQTYLDFRKENGLPMEIKRGPRPTDIQRVDAESVRKKATALIPKVKKTQKNYATISKDDRANAKRLGYDIKFFMEFKGPILAAEIAGKTLNQYLTEKEAKKSEPAPATKSAAQVAKEEIAAEKARLAKEDDLTQKEKEALAAFNKEIGFEEDEDLDVEYVSAEYIQETETELAARGEKSIAKVLSRSKLKEISASQYVALGTNKTQGFLKDLMNVLFKNKKNLNLKFYTLIVNDSDAKSIHYAGAYYSNTNAKRGAIVIVTKQDGTPIGNPAVYLHELVHPYTKLMAKALYKNNTQFAQEIGRVFNTVKSEIRSQLLTVILTAKSGNPLTKNEKAVADAITKFVMNRYGRITLTFEELIDSSYTDPANKGKSNVEIANAIISKVLNQQDAYGLTSASEMLSELFSDGNFAALLSQIKIKEQIKNGPFKGNQKSLLYKWFETFIGFIRKSVPSLTPVENNAYEYILDTVQLYDAEFSNEVLEQDSSIKGNPFNPLPEFLANKTPKQLTGKQIAEKIKNSLVRQLEMVAGIKDEASVRKFIKRLNSKLPLKSQISEDVFAPPVWEELAKRRGTLKGDMQLAKLALDYMRNDPEYKKGNSKLRADVDNFAEVDMTKLNATERHQFVSKGLIPLAYNNANMPQKVYNMVINSIVENRTNEIVKIAPKLRKGWGTRTVMKGANIMTATSAMSRFKQGVADTVLKLIHKDFLWAATQSGVEAQAFWEKLTKVADKGNLTHKHLAKIGMYGRIFSTKTSPALTEAWENEIRQAADFVLKSAQAKLQAKLDDVYKGNLSEEQIRTEVKIAEELNNAIQNQTIFLPGQLDPKDRRNILSPAEQQVYKEITEFAKVHEPAFFRNAQAVWGQQPKQLYNYFPSLAQGKLGLSSTNDFRNDPLIRGGADNLYDALSDDSSYGKYNTIHGKKVWSSYERENNPEGYFYEFDALIVGKKWSKTMLFDTYASTPLKISNKLLANKKVEKAFGVKTRDAIVHQIKTAAGAGMIYDPNVGTLAKKFLKFRDSLYMAGIVTSGQFVLQLSSGIAASAAISASINPLKAAATMTKAIAASSMSLSEMSKFNKFLIDNGLGIQLRDVGFEKFLSPEDFKSTNRKLFNSAQIKMENLSDLAIRSGDKLAARMVWFAAYFDAGGTIENPNRDAILKAERLTGTLQNMSDARWTAPMFRSNNVYKKILMGMLYAYKSFSLNAWLSMMSGLRDFNNKEARMIAAAQMGSYIAFHAASVALIKPMWKALADKATDMFDGDDEEDEEEKNFNKLDEIVTNAAWDMAIGSPLPGAADQFVRWLVVQGGVAQKIWGDPDEEFNQYVDSPLYGPSNPDKIMQSAFGPGTKEAMTIPIDIASGLLLYTSAALADEAITEEHQFKASQHWLNAFSDVIGAWGMIPFRGDMRRILKGTHTERKDRLRRANDAMRGAGKSQFGTDVDGNYNDTYNDTYIDMTDLENWTDDGFANE